MTVFSGSAYIHYYYYCLSIEEAVFAVSIVLWIPVRYGQVRYVCMVWMDETLLLAESRVHKDCIILFMALG